MNPVALLQPPEMSNNARGIVAPPLAGVPASTAKANAALEPRPTTLAAKEHGINRSHANRIRHDK